MRLRAERLSQTRTAEVLVLGGGPAGSAAAVVLAAAGHRVVLVRPARPAGAPLVQSVPPSARALLADLGMLAAVDAAGFVPNRGNTVGWAGSAPRTERFADSDHGYHAGRGALESALDPVVRAAGVTVLSGASARSATRADGTWRVRCIDPMGRSVEVESPWVVDATGRHGFFARRLGRTPDRRTTTLALVSRVAGAPDDPAVRGHTLVESFEDGWAWSVPVGPGSRCVTAMVDPRETRVDSAALGSVLADQLRKAPLVGALAGCATSHADAWACPASLYTCTRYVDDGIVLAGDAGSFIDPLSSYGVKKALVSGRLAGIVVATCLADRGMTRHALDYHEAHERGVAHEYHTRSAGFFEDASAYYGHSFWTRRLAAAREPAETLAPPDGAPLPTVANAIEVPPDEVRRAHQRLTSAARLAVRTGDSTRTVSAPAPQGRRIVLEDHLVSEDHPRPIRFHHSVDLRRLVALAPGTDDVADLWSTYNRSGAAVDLPELITALAAACAAGFLTTGDA